MFVEKTVEEYEALTTEEKAAYLKEKAEHDSELRQKEIQKAIDKAREEDSEANKGQIEGLEAQLKEVKNALKVTSLQIKSITEGSKGEAEKSELLKFIERDRSKRNEGHGMESVTVKAAALMTTANVLPNVGDGFNQLFGNYIDPTIYNTPKPDNFILGLVDVAPAPGSENIWYVERVNEEGTAQFISEGALKPLADGEWQERKAPVQEVAVRWKMSKRLINHAPSVVSDFRTHVDELMDQVIDDGVLAGDGVAPNLTGIATAASPFVVPAELALYYVDANIYDAIMSVATYVRLNNFKGSLTCVLNTVWEAKMKGVKKTDGEYIIPPFVLPSGQQVGEVRIVFSNKIDSAKILLGDLRKFKVRISEDVQYFEGWENDDFSKNLESRKLEAFLGTYLPTSDSGAIIYDDIATVLTAIDKP